MLSNELHITRANYEEYFLLYVDGELSAAQNDAVEAFVAQHPDLQEELDILLTTKLDAEPVFFNKEALMADNMKHLAIDESLLLYVDNELPAEERAAVETKLETDANYQYQHSLLLKTKLPAEAITYPDKTELYRKEERTIRPVLWYRVAAAVFVLLAGGYMWSLTGKVTPDTGVAIQTPVIKKAVPAPSSTDQAPAGVTTQPAIETQEPVEAKTNTASTSNITERGTTTRPAEALASRSSVQAPVIVPDTRLEIPEVKRTAIPTQEQTQRIARAEQPQQNINNQPVTNISTPTYNKQTTTGEPSAVSTAVAIETDNNKRGSVKGFLRKATRFIERRTGVVTTNDDNELLIGALAINLK